MVKYNLISGGFYSTLARYTDIKRDVMTGFALTQIVTVIFIFISSFLMFHSGDQVLLFVLYVHKVTRYKFIKAKTVIVYALADLPDFTVCVQTTSKGYTTYLPTSYVALQEQS